MYRTFGAPSGAEGCVYGSQSGVESLMSMLIVPLNGLGMVVLSNGCGGRPDAVRRLVADATNALRAQHHPVGMNICATCRAMLSACSGNSDRLWRSAG